MPQNFTCKVVKNRCKVVKNAKKLVINFFGKSLILKGLAKIVKKPKVISLFLQNTTKKYQENKAKKTLQFW